MSGSTGRPRAEDAPACKACKRGVRSARGRALGGPLSGGLWSCSGPRVWRRSLGPSRRVQRLQRHRQRSEGGKRCLACAHCAPHARTSRLGSTPASWPGGLTSGASSSRALARWGRAGVARRLPPPVCAGAGFVPVLLSSRARSPRSSKRGDDSSCSHPTEGTARSNASVYEPSLERRGAAPEAAALGAVVRGSEPGRSRRQLQPCLAGH